MSNRSIIYVDGFNLYYGAVKDTKGKKWLNLEIFFRRLRPHDDVRAIKYFTTLVDGCASGHQEAYLLALSTLPTVEVIYGKFKPKMVRCGVKACSWTGERWFRVLEEKRTDVNIAVTMMLDVLEDNCDRLVVVSGDSDLVPAISTIKALAPGKQITVYVPARNLIRGAAVEIRAAADKHRTLPNDLIAKSQFPATIRDGKGGYIQRPQDW